MNNFSKLDKLLITQSHSVSRLSEDDVCAYARCMADVENVIAVVSDLAMRTSKIFSGAFAQVLGIEGYIEENSIWEKEILSLLPEHEQEEKFIAELRFYHYLRSMGAARQNYYLMSKLKFVSKDGVEVNALHRMYYIYNKGADAVRYAICLYGPLSFDFKGKSVAVNSLTGVCEELTSSSDTNILSRRERQVLSLIDSGLKSKEIADKLSISVYTVSRHRQEIISKLQVKNSIEACRLARSMELI